MEGAIQREKRLKKWTRAWKIKLIEETNPAWTDLYSGYCSAAQQPPNVIPAKAGIHPSKRAEAR